jgi:hypothetical protein
MEAWQHLEEEWERPDTLTQHTTTGGLHFVFKDGGHKYRGKLQGTQRKEGGIDVKHNGYIVVYPSVKNGKRYKWADWKSPINDVPDWLLELIKKDHRKGKASPAFKFGSDYITKLVEELRKFPLDYHEWVQAGMAIHSAHPDNEGLQLYLRLTDNPSMQDGDLEKAEEKWESFSETPSGVTSLTLRWLIKDKGGKVPNPFYEEDKKLFLEAQIESMQNEAERNKGFYEDGERFVNWDAGDIVDSFNKWGFAYLANGGNTPFLKIKKVDGEIEYFSMRETDLRNFMAPYFLATYKVQQNGVKKVLSPAYREWVESHRRKRYKDIIFSPNGPKDALNLWPNTIAKVDPLDGQPDSILSLIHDSLCNNDDTLSNWLLDWLAHIIQKPHIRCATVPVHVSQQGAGKGLLYDLVMRPILGKQFVAVETSKELTAQFNINLSRKFLTFIDEATWRGNKTEDGILKRLTASPTMTVEEKFGAKYELENYSRYAIASNNEDAVSLEIGNRRYVFIQADNSKANDLSWFGPLTDNIKRPEELGRFVNYLETRDIESFNPYRIISGNTGGATSKLNSEGSVASFWDDVFSQLPRALWHEGEFLDTNLVFNEYKQWVREINHYEKAVTSHLFWQRSIKCFGGLPSLKLKRFDGDRRYTRHVSPMDAMRNFYRTMEISPPSVFNPNDYSIRSDFTNDEEFFT